MGWSGFGPIRSLRAALLLMMTLAVAPIMLFASGMAVMRAQETQPLPNAAAWLAVSALPLLIGSGSILVVALVWEAMVMRWLVYLERLSRAYARGRYSVRPRRLQEAPVEFRGLGRAVEEMASAVEHRDQALRDALDEQTVLLREVHHRVKNNLQIVGSLLSLQVSRATEPAARDALLDALVRLDAIALGQRFMREQEDEEQVHAIDLFDAFTHQVHGRLGGDRGLDIVCDIEPCMMPLETGSRLVILTAETLLHALHTSSGPVAFHIGLRFEDDGVILTVSPPLDLEAASPDARVCRDLIQGYVRQLRGRLETTADGSSLVLRAPLRGPVQEPLPAPANDHAPRTPRQGPKFFRILERTERGFAS